MACTLDPQIGHVVTTRTSCTLSDKVEATSLQLPGLRRHGLVGSGNEGGCPDWHHTM